MTEKRQKLEIEKYLREFYDTNDVSTLTEEQIARAVCLKLEFEDVGACEKKTLEEMREEVGENGRIQS